MQERIKKFKVKKIKVKIPMSDGVLIDAEIKIPQTIKVAEKCKDIEMKEWPTKEEIKELERIENERAIRFNDETDPICQCGEPGWCCRCKELAEKIGYWPDGTPFNIEEE